MDDRARREENDDNHNHRTSSPREADQRGDSNQRRESADERPALTERERRDRWPIG